MSVEALVVTAVVDEGAAGLRKCYHAGVSRQDFTAYEEEFVWIEDTISTRKPLSVRTFRRRFPDFEWLPPTESLKDLLVDLKNERAFVETNTLIESISEDLRVDNAVELAEHARDALSGITRLFAPVSDFSLIGGWQDHYEEQRRLRVLRDGGETPGIPTGLEWIDFHWDGLLPGRMIVVLGRPGEGKSYLVARFVWGAIKNKYRVLFISPEMNKREHTCRLHTLASADPDVKKALGLSHSFRNRALMNGKGYNLKTYKRFCQYLAEECGEVHMPTGINRRLKMTPAYVEAKVNDIQPDLLVVDPIYKLKPPRDRKTTFEEISDTSDLIQDIAESYNIPVIVTNQAHRQQSKRDDAPHKDSSFGTDVPIQEADHVIGVKNMSEEHRMIVRCSKSRFGADFRFELEFWPNTGKMVELEKPSGSYYNGSDDDPDEEELKQIVANAVTGKEDANG